ncbi:MAG: hypothetical protein ACI4MA_04290 [Treponema sp.]|nr:hypothetical protein [Spirochaetia bacterium]MDD7699669.1 hypothetical protein [Spirochaetia bacterium]MDY4211955.1 hypothetical protein [Treponema sp.]
MDKQLQKCIEIMRNLVSDIQGAPYPGEEVKPELYAIWYEHVQRDAINAFEFLDEHFPDRADFTKSIDKIFK